MDSFSKAVAEQLFTTYPEWQGLAREEQSEGDGAFLVVEVPAPPEAQVEQGLVISTEDGEITVSFDCYHAHFCDWVGEGKGRELRAALEFVGHVLSEKVAIYSWWLDAQWRGSTAIEPGLTPDGSSIPSFNRLRIRSWRGTFNADQELTKTK